LIFYAFKASRQFELRVMPGGSSEMTGKLEKADKPVGKLTKLWADLVSVGARSCSDVVSFTTRYVDFQIF